MNQLLIHGNRYFLGQLRSNILIVAEFIAQYAVSVNAFGLQTHGTNQRNRHIFTGSIRLRIEERLSLHRKISGEIILGGFNIFVSPGGRIHIREGLCSIRDQVKPKGQCNQLSQLFTCNRRFRLKGAIGITRNNALTRHTLYRFICPIRCFHINKDIR
ncbi:hypothetical protein D3C75_945040 [compost metagenome]